MPRPSFAGEIAPDHLRCRRSDGRRWRCPLRAMDGLSFCEHHYRLSRRNLAKSHSAEHLKPGKKNHRRRRSPPEPLDAPPSKRRRRGQHPAEEPLAAMIKRRVVKEEKDKKMESPEPAAAGAGPAAAEEEEGEVTRDLPNGVMTISPAPKKDRRRNAGSPVNRKLGIDEGTHLRRRIRSKNAELVPVATVKRIPRVKDLGKRRKKACHRCGERKVARMVRCSSCQKRFFCSSCIKKWYSYMSEKEVKNACPTCRGYCDCKTCNHAGAKDGDRSKLIPCLKQIDNEQLNKLEIEANSQGRKFSGTQTQLAERKENEPLNCNYCKIRLVDFHRSCSTCIGFV